jgi:ribosomal protein S12 methylthiotransferase accessory factor
VIAAVSAEPDGRDVSLGFAARLDVHSAAASALTEMLQLELSLAAARSMGASAPSWHHWRRTVRMTTSPLDAAFLPHALSPRMGLSSVAGCTGLTAALDACAAAGIDVWFADLTRAAIGVPVFRALSTTLCHYKPRFGRRRLLAPDDGDLDRVSGSPRLRPALRI